MPFAPLVKLKKTIYSHKVYFFHFFTDLKCIQCKLHLANEILISYGETPRLDVVISVALPILPPGWLSWSVASCLKFSFLPLLLVKIKSSISLQCGCQFLARWEWGDDHTSREKKDPKDAKQHNNRWMQFCVVMETRLIILYSAAF